MMRGLATAAETVRAHMLLASLAPCTRAHVAIKAAILVRARSIGEDPVAIEALAREIEDSCSGFEPLALEMLQLAAAVRVLGGSLVARH